MNRGRNKIQVTVYLEPATAAEAYGFARLAGVGVSEFVRRAVVAAVKRAREQRSIDEFMGIIEDAEARRVPNPHANPNSWPPEGGERTPKKLRRMLTGEGRL